MKKYKIWLIEILVWGLVVVLITFSTLKWQKQQNELHSTGHVFFSDTDGLIVTRKNIPIALRFADCTPLIFYDTKQKIGAISHAGWRGTTQKIGPKTILKMGVNFGSNPDDIIAIIGPAIGLCCYEVSDEVRNKLLETVEDSTNLVQGKNVDLKQINSRQLEEIGVTKIDICPYCTSCDNDLFYSYRKGNGTAERHYAMLML